MPRRVLPRRARPGGKGRVGLGIPRCIVHVGIGSKAAMAGILMAQLPPPPEMALPVRHLRFVPICDIRPPKSFAEHAKEKLPNPTMDDQKHRGDGMAQHRTGLGDAWVGKSAATPNHESFGLLNTDD
jgi:hypothetical protein